MIGATRRTQCRAVRAVAAGVAAALAVTPFVSCRSAGGRSGAADCPAPHAGRSPAPNAFRTGRAVPVDGGEVVVRPYDGTGAPIVARSTDGGRTWTSSPLPVPHDVHAVRAHGLQAQHRDVFVFSTGQQRSTSADASVVHSSSDGGRSWQAGRLPAPARHQGPITAVYRLGDRLVALANVADRGPGRRRVAAWTSDDGGRVWDRVPVTAFGLLGAYERWQGGGFVDRGGRLFASAVGIVPADGPGSAELPPPGATLESVATVWTTTDGRRWSPIADAEALPSGTVVRAGAEGPAGDRCRSGPP